MSLIPNDLNLPFLVANSISFSRHKPHVMPDYIYKHKKFLTRKFDEENASINYKKTKCLHTIGLDKTPKTPYPVTHALKLNRGLVTAKDWQMPPNLYDITNEPYERQRGDFGAHWAKLHTHKSKQPKSKTKHRQYYDVPAVSDIWSRCNKFKGVLMSNPRDRIATVRSMVADMGNCYRNPKDPGAAHYYSRTHELSYNVSPELKPKRHNPYKFHLNSIVPARTYSYESTNSTFLPGPGRFENRFGVTCAAKASLNYEIGISARIEREKRKKFRRQKYNKIKIRHYYTPEWCHIYGHGFTRLFKGVKKSAKDRRKNKKSAKKSDKTFVTYPDAKYIYMINNPIRQTMSLRRERLKHRLRITYNTLAKRIIRKSLQVNKKVAFLSGQSRWKTEPPPQLLASELLKLKQSLPPERQLWDRPVMTVPRSEIKPKFDEIYDRFQPEWTPELRKKLFKFLPLPPEKQLLKESTILQVKRDGTPYEGLFTKKLEVTSYFKTEESVVAFKELLERQGMI